MGFRCQILLAVISLMLGLSLILLYSYSKNNEVLISTTIIQPMVNPNNVESSVKLTDNPSIEPKRYLEDVYISIKSSEGYPVSRLPVMVLTWLKLVPSKNIFVVTDRQTPVTDTVADHHGFTIYYSKCPNSHHREDLICKTNDELDLFYTQVDKGNKYSWYCHVDDDMYTNVIELQKLLSEYEYDEPHFLGKTLQDGYRTLSNGSINNFHNEGIEIKHTTFSFTLGAIYCFSKRLMTEMKSSVRNKGFVKLSKLCLNQHNDDVLLGFVNEGLLGFPEVTGIDKMYSHIHRLEAIKNLKEMITISYRLPGDIPSRTINLPDGVFSIQDDPTRFFSYHCLLFPSVSWCNTTIIPQLKDPF